MGYRVQRVEKIIERELASIIFSEVHNELIKFVSITKVALNKDMSVALVWYTVLGNDGEIEATKKALDQAKGFLRSELAHRLDLRKTPELRFKYDESLAYGNHISEVIENLKK
ncbi:MAG: 30S ribosome-binding factor RbfA [Bacilli bacterium]|jgi:ribosome-binding factor A|nr:30S ribosome-binding factor RbfA [Bacilli bacterium]